MNLQELIIILAAGGFFAIAGDEGEGIAGIEQVNSSLLPERL